MILVLPAAVQIVLRLVLAVFACYRLARLVAREDGPWMYLVRARLWLASWDTPAGRKVRPRWWHVVTAQQPLGIKDLLECPYCLGEWFALALTAAVFMPTLPGDVFLVWQGVAGAQAFLQEVNDARTQ